MAGSMGTAIVVGFILMAIIGWVPIFGALIAGVVCGLIARGAKRGLVAGFVAGVVGLIILSILFALFGAAIGGASGAIFGSLAGFGTATILGILGLSGIILISIGGLIGGALRPH